MMGTGFGLLTWMGWVLMGRDSSVDGKRDDGAGLVVDGERPNVDGEELDSDGGEIDVDWKGRKGLVY